MFAETFTIQDLTLNVRVDPYGNYWWVPALELACSAYSAALDLASQGYNDSLEENYQGNASIDDSLNNQDVRRCIEQYQIHRDKCRLNKCMEEATLRAKGRRDQQQKKYEEERQKNPYDKYKPASCTFTVKSPKPKVN